MTDTSPEASKVYFDLLAAKTPSERLRIGAALCEASQTLQWSMARRRYPNADETELAYHVAAARYGQALARSVYRRD